MVFGADDGQFGGVVDDAPDGQSRGQTAGLHRAGFGQSGQERDDPRRDEPFEFAAHRSANGQVADEDDSPATDAALVVDAADAADVDGHADHPGGSADVGRVDQRLVRGGGFRAATGTTHVGAGDVQSGHFESDG